MTQKRLIIAIDGPAGSGKSTAARMLAMRLGYAYIDTGAMYRALACQVRDKNVNIRDSEKIAGVCRTVQIELHQLPQGAQVLLDGRDVTKAIRDHDVSAIASTISAEPLVRECLLELQRKMGRLGGVVMEGRDIGTVVFPDADVKFFFDATAEERAKRRHLELLNRGESVEYEQILRDLQERDRADTSRAVAPLCCADDATVVDTTQIGPEAVVDRMVDTINLYLDSRVKGEDLNE